MYKLGAYNQNNRMSDLVCDNYPVLLVMSRFGIALGFGDKSIGEVCRENGVHTETFLAVVNLLLDEGDVDDYKNVISAGALLEYLHNSHDYFLNFRLPAIRCNLLNAIDGGEKDISIAILRFFDEYVAEVQKHMRYEESTVFPYVNSLLAGVKPDMYSIAIFRKRHDQVEAKLTELKNILIKYYPASSSNELNSVLFDIFTCEQDLASHNYIEDYLFIPVIQTLEYNIERKKWSLTIDNEQFLRYQGEVNIVISDLEKDERVNVIGNVLMSDTILNSIKQGKTITFIMIA